MANQDTDLLMRLAVLIKLTDPSGKATQTATFKQLSSTIVEDLMEPANHARYLKVRKEVESEFRAASASVEGIPASLQAVA